MKKLGSILDLGVLEAILKMNNNLAIDLGNEFHNLAWLQTLSINLKIKAILFWSIQKINLFLICQSQNKNRLILLISLIHSQKEAINHRKEMSPQLI